MAGETLLILHLESPNRGAQGDTVYRTQQPCDALGLLPGVTVVSGSVLSPEAHALCDAADVLVLCDLVDADLLPVIERRSAAGRLTAYEINDDFLSPQPWSPTAYLAENPVTRSLSSQLAACSGALQFTVRELERRFGHLGARRAIFRNHLWEAPPEPAKPAGLRIGWGGSLGHKEDVAAVAPALRRFALRHPEARLAIMGAPELHALFAGLPPDRVELRPAGSLADWYAFVGSLHVGVCPLLPTDFNRCRSDVKFLEYAAHRALPLCADLEPYRDAVRPGETGFFFEGAGGLEALLERAAADPALRARVAERACAAVRGERLERPRAPDRLAFYQECARALGAPLAPRAHPELEALVLERRAPARAGGRHHALAGPLEALLYEGLQLLRQRPPEAARRFAEAARRAPAFHLPLVYLGQAEADPRAGAEALRRALALAPGSCSASFLLAARLEEAGEREAAIAELQRCEAIAPAFGAAAARQGELAEAAGEPGRAEAHHRRALAQNPFLTGAALRLALLALGAGRSADAAALLGESVRRDGRHAGSRLLLGRALVDLGRHGEALPHLEAALARTRAPAPVLAQLARAQAGLGNDEAARYLLAELARLRG